MKQHQYPEPPQPDYNQQTRLFWLPSAITTIALVAGFSCVVLAADPTQPHRFDYIPLLVGLAVFCDGLDGRVARAVGACTAFGETFDSFADLVAFGVAPAFMIYQLSLRALPIPGVAALVIAAFFVFSNAFRLARFATKEYNPRYFEGMPTTAGGAFIASLAYWGISLPPIAAAVSVIVTALLMSSRIQFPKLGQICHRAPYMIKWALLLVIVAVLLPLQARLLSLVIVGYMFYALFWSTKRAVRRRLRPELSLATLGIMPGSSGAQIAGITSFTRPDDEDQHNEANQRDDWDDDWKSEDDS
jgi:CDP-diacylglycerol--serine O-phosphatidyltransferase